VLGLAGIGGDDVDREALWGHAVLWDPWFVLWGVLLWRAVSAGATGTARTGRRAPGTRAAP
jgi:hypothetical protein